MDGYYTITEQQYYLTEVWNGLVPQTARPLMYRYPTNSSSSFDWPSRIPWQCLSAHPVGHSIGDYENSLAVSSGKFEGLTLYCWLRIDSETACAWTGPSCSLLDLLSSAGTPASNYSQEQDKNELNIKYTSNEQASAKIW